MGISPVTLAKNISVEVHLAEAAALTERAANLFATGKRTRPLQFMSAAVSELSVADRAMSLLSARTNVLSDATHRWTSHALRDAEQALGMLERRGTMHSDARAILSDLLARTRVSTSRALEEAGVSLHEPQIRALPDVRPSAPVHTPPAEVVIDGQLLDALGNPGSSTRNAGGFDGMVSEFATRGSDSGSFDIPSHIFLG